MTNFVHLDARIESWLGSISGGFSVRPRFLRLDELRAEMVTARRLTNTSVLASDLSNVCFVCGELAVNDFQ
jgi:hypothetical protein